MLHKIDFKISFNSNNKVFSGTHEFDVGMTSITGPNERGKSLRMEMIRYALFGSKALRAPLSTYKDLYVSLDFSVKGVKYRVVRAKASTKLYTIVDDEAEDLTSGTTPTNSEIIRIFGYGIDVFDAANACLQNEIEAMSKMKPAERKQMVDRTIGLNVVDTVIAEASKTMIGIDKQIDQLNKLVLQDLSEPTAPNGLKPIDVISRKLKEVSEKVARVIGLEAELNAITVPDPGDRPKAPQYDLDELYQQKIARDSLGSKILFLQKEMGTLPKAVNRVDNIEALKKYLDDGMPEKWNAYYHYQHLLSAVKTPTFTREQLEKFKLIIDNYHDLEYVSDPNHLTVTCPECQHNFPTNWDTIELVRNKLPQELLSDDFQPWITEYREKHLNKINHTMEEHIIKCYEDFCAVPVVERPDGTDLGLRHKLEATLANGYRYAEDMQKYLAHQKQLDELVATWSRLPKDIDAKIEETKQLIAASVKYDSDLERYNKYIANRERILFELSKLEGVNDDHDRLVNELNEANLYQRSLEFYFEKKERNDEVLAMIEGLKKEYDQHKAAKKALSDLKPKVKTYLVPSLAKSASKLLSDMTNGVRNKIEISPDFDITVDGDMIETLSGSGKAVANLAVRLALGTVLTNKVFSVFMVDEVDASMDEDRAKYTAECLRNLTKVFGQIILISHKEPEADHQIKL